MVSGYKNHTFQNNTSNSVTNIHRNYKIQALKIHVLNFPLLLLYTFIRITALFHTAQTRDQVYMSIMYSVSVAWKGKTQTAVHTPLGGPYMKFSKAI